MGLNNQSNDKKTFLNIVAGKFAVSAKQGDEGAVSRVNKKGNTVWEILYDNLSDVTIKSIEKEIGDYGASWKVTLKDMDIEYQLSLSYSGRVTNGFTHRLPNIDMGKPVTLRLYTIEEKTYMVVYQANKKIEAAYTKDNPNGLPPLEKVKLKGVETWDDSKQSEFIENMIETTIKPQLAAMKMGQSSDTPESFSHEEVSDLPF